MKAATERKIIRWIHLIESIPITGYIYGPVPERPEAVIVIRFILFPLVVLTGLWMWKDYPIKRWLCS
jgi:hypothetical protein